jgi:hypothetical protein
VPRGLALRRNLIHTKVGILLRKEKSFGGFHPHLLKDEKETNPIQLSINHLFELVTGAEYQHYTLILSFLIPAWILEQRTDIHKIVRTLKPQNTNN